MAVPICWITIGEYVSKWCLEELSMPAWRSIGRAKRRKSITEKYSIDNPPKRSMGARGVREERTGGVSDERSRDCEALHLSLPVNFWEPN